MKPRDQGGVVDSKLNVYGLQGVKVAGTLVARKSDVSATDDIFIPLLIGRKDLSISPGNVGANTYSTAIAIGEKAALLVAEELGISI
jgi:alcohol oxidase